MARIASAFILTLISLLATPAAAAGEMLPLPASLQPNVRFWTRIYSEIDLSGGMIHDSRNLDIVYEVMRFPPGLSRREHERKVAKAKRDCVIALKRLARGERENLSEKDRQVLSRWPEGVSNKTLATAAKNVRFQRGQADRFKAGLERAGAWRSHIEQVFDQAGLPREFVALPHVESSYRADAYSSIGAAGLWQFTRSTGRLYMRVDNVVDERLDAHAATYAAAKLLKRNYELLGSWPLAITAYNHGAGGMARAVRKVGSEDIGKIVTDYNGRTFGFASRNFYAEFLAALEVDRNSQRYFGPIHQDRPRNFERVVLDAYYPPSALEKAFGIDRKTLESYNPSLRPAVWNGNKYVPKDFKLALPPESRTLPSEELLAAIPTSDRKSEQHRDRYYKVRRGDSLSRIAQRYRIRIRELVAANNLRSRHRIRVGQVLVLPDHAYRSRGNVARTDRPKDGIYRVRRGDNLSAIAERFGVSAREVATANRLRNRNRVYVGQKLRIPTTNLPAVASSAHLEDGVYKVRRGDNLSAIARRFGVSAQEVVAANGLRNRNQLAIGQTLRIPGGDASPTASGSRPKNGIYRVQHGDSLSAIASRFDVSESALVAENALRNRHHVYVGQDLRIPEPVDVATAKPEKPAEPVSQPQAEPAATVSEVDGPARIATRDQPDATAAADSSRLDSQTASLEPEPTVSAASGPPPPDPSDYEVDSKGRVTVQAAETLGHYAEWLEIKTSRLRRLNSLKFGTSVAIGRKTMLDFSHVTSETFEQRRLAYHHTLQEEYFTAFEVIGTRTHLIRSGESLWYLAERKYEVPVWLIRQYNPDLDFSALQSGTRMVIPEVGRRGA
ncbi:MAG: LysM peptidoglycan-binding domain-containing protein [Deltaproteobacteria bacterium]|nr:LysM peptidoglycan-binding domain-containing protein [Deltaproteobacteria bacterium]